MIDISTQNQETKNIKIKFKVWIEVDGKHLIGPGGYEILKLVDELKSVSKTARKLGLSYKFVWSYIKNIEKLLGKQLVYSWRGGKEKGGTTLTEYGRKLIQFYEDLNRAIENVINEYYTRFIREFYGEQTSSQQ